MVVPMNVNENWDWEWLSRDWIMMHMLFVGIKAWYIQSVVLLTGCAVEVWTAGGVNVEGTVVGAIIDIIGGIHGCKEEEFDIDSYCSKLG